jgi:predicted FMN-binding regulatory protein PaiB
MDPNAELPTPIKPENSEAKEVDPIEEARRQAVEDTLKAVLDRIGNYAASYKAITEAQKRDRPWARDLKPADAFYEQISGFVDINLEALQKHEVSLVEDPGNPFGVTLNTNNTLREIEGKKASEELLKKAA